MLDLTSIQLHHIGGYGLVDPAMFCGKRKASFMALRLYEFILKTLSTMTGVIFVIMALAFTINVNVKFGENFWNPIKYEIFRFADEPEIKIQDKEKIIVALRKIRLKLKPFTDAIFND